MKSIQWRACATAVSIALGGVAVAQDAPVDEVTVTGSRLRTSGFQTPTPVTSVTADDLDWADTLVGFRRPPGFGNVRWIHSIGAGVDGFTEMAGPSVPPAILLTRASQPFGQEIGEYVVARVLAACQHLGEVRPVLARGDVEGHIGDPLGEVREHLGIEGVADMLPAGGLDLREVVRSREMAARDADDPAAFRHLLVALAPVQRRHELAVAEVAGGAEHDEIEDGDGDDLSCH